MVFVCALSNTGSVAGATGIVVVTVVFGNGGDDDCVGVADSVSSGSHVDDICIGIGMG